MLKSSLIFFVVTLSNLFGPASRAAPLGTIPSIERSSTRFIIDLRSDLWTSPYTYKSSPVQINSLGMLLPLFRSNEWAVSAEISGESLSLGRPDFYFGEKQVYVGSTLQSFYGGLGVSKNLSDGGQIAVFAASASASDEPEKNPGDSWIEANIVYWSAPIENHRWLFFLNRSHNRGFLNDEWFPYIGVQYQPSSDFQAVFGLPFLKLNWEKPELWKKEFLLTPFGFHYDLTKDLEDNILFNAFAEFTVRSYLNSERLDPEQRLYYQEYAVETNLQRILSKHTKILFGLGWSFNRQVYEAKTIYRPESGTQDIDDDLYVRLVLEFKL